MAALLLALGQRDLKRILAYSTVENVGLVAFGLGVGLAGAALGAPSVAALGVAGALLHVWNHALMKGLAFMGAGAIVHGAGTRDVERMGGLLRRLPVSAGLVVFAAAALAALPPLNGFVSEWLLYVGLLDGGRGATAGVALVAYLCLAALALVGALAAVVFTRLVGAALLGAPRSPEAASAHEGGPLLLAPLAILAAANAAVALFPGEAVAMLTPAAALVLRVPEAALASTLAPAVSALEGPLRLGLAALVVTGVALALASRRMLARRDVRPSATWGCGFAAESARVQYTAASLSELALAAIAPRPLRPTARAVPPAGVFPAPPASRSRRTIPPARGCSSPPSGARGVVRPAAALPAGAAQPAAPLHAPHRPRALGAPPPPPARPMTILPVLGAIALPAASGLAAVALRRRPAAGQAVACATLCAGAALGLVAAAAALAGGEVSAPGLGLRVDALSAVFLAPICAVCALGAIYGLGYFPQAALGARAVRLQLYYGLVTAGMVLLVAASNAIAFLVGWEVMALSAFLLVHTDHERAEVQRAAFVYLAATHVGTIALFALFALLRQTAGSFEFAAMQGLSGAGPRASFAFALALVGFGLKAGLMPLHFWLPGAHAATPSHISAVMSGVLIKTGIYGLLRVTGFFDAPPAAWGTALLLLGGASAVLGVAFALAQHDLKRLLAYHSVENIGIIALGAGLALLGRARGEPALVMLGLGGAALHVVNHALFKSLLFLGAGAVQHATGTRELDLLGGLARPMRATAILFLVGAAAICGLPPLNGFVSEWLVYLGFLAAMERGGHELFAFAVLGVPVLALVGGLAAGCFAKVVGVVFLGTPRSAHARAAHEAPRTMLAPMAILAGACIAIGLAPAAVLPALVRVGPGLVAARPRPPRPAGGARERRLVARERRRRRAAPRRGRRRPSPPPAPRAPRGRPSTSSGRAARRDLELRLRRADGAHAVHGIVLRRAPRAPLLVGDLPARSVPRLEGPFPAEARFHTVVPDTVLDLGLAPAARGFRWLATRAHLLYLRRIQFQVLLLLATLVAALAWGFVW